MVRLVTVLLLIASSSALAQPAPDRMPFERPPEPVRFQVNVNFFAPGTVNASDESLKAQENARKKMYEIASHECAVLQTVIAKECRLESANVNINRMSNQQADGFTINGNFTYRILMK